jgi:hypothetical protein
VRKIAAMMRKATGARATMWGSSIVGYGQVHAKDLTNKVRRP